MIIQLSLNCDVIMHDNMHVIIESLPLVRSIRHVVAMAHSTELETSAVSMQINEVIGRFLNIFRKRSGVVDVVALALERTQHCISGQGWKGPSLNARPSDITMCVSTMH